MLSSNLKYFCAFVIKYKLLQPNQVLFRIGEVGDKFYIILKGKVDIMKIKIVKKEFKFIEFINYLRHLILLKEYHIYEKTIEDNKEMIYYFHEQYLLYEKKSEDRKKSVEDEKEKENYGDNDDNNDNDDKGNSDFGAFTYKSSNNNVSTNKNNIQLDKVNSLKSSLVHTSAKKYNSLFSDLLKSSILSSFNKGNRLINRQGEKKSILFNRQILNVNKEKIKENVNSLGENINSHEKENNNSPTKLYTHPSINRRKHVNSVDHTKSLLDVNFNYIKENYSKIKENISKNYNKNSKKINISHIDFIEENDSIDNTLILTKKRNSSLTQNLNTKGNNIDNYKKHKKSNLQVSINIKQSMINSEIVNYQYKNEILDEFDTLKKTYKVYDYFKLLELGTGNYFGDFAIEGDQKRTATIIAKDNSVHLGVIDASFYLSYIKNEKIKAMKSELNLLVDNYIFSSIKKNRFEKMYITYFQRQVYRTDEEIISEGEIVNIYFLKSKSVEIINYMTIPQLYSLLDELFEEIGLSLGNINNNTSSFPVIKALSDKDRKILALLKSNKSHLINFYNNEPVLKRYIPNKILVADGNKIFNLIEFYLHKNKPFFKVIPQNNNTILYKIHIENMKNIVSNETLLLDDIKEYVFSSVLPLALRIADAINFQVERYIEDSQRTDFNLNKKINDRNIKLKDDMNNIQKNGLLKIFHVKEKNKNQFNENKNSQDFSDGLQGFQKKKSVLNWNKSKLNTISFDYMKQTQSQIDFYNNNNKEKISNYEYSSDVNYPCINNNYKESIDLYPSSLDLQTHRTHIKNSKSQQVNFSKKEINKDEIIKNLKKSNYSNLARSILRCERSLLNINYIKKMNVNIK